MLSFKDFVGEKVKGYDMLPETHAIWMTCHARAQHAGIVANQIIYNVNLDLARHPSTCCKLRIRALVF
jgi:hypothetical protein